MRGSFSAKKSTGPLSNWCAACNAHRDHHRTGRPCGIRGSGGAPPPPTPHVQQWDLKTQPAGAKQQAEEVKLSKLNRRAKAELRKTVVFDFDCTLSTKHVGGFDVTSDIANRCFGGIARLNLLLRLFEFLRSSQVAIFVITRNSSYVVNKALGGVGLLPFVTSVLGFEQYGQDTPKSNIIARQILEPSGFASTTHFKASGIGQTQQLLFVDDDQTNIRDAQATLGCAVLAVNSKTAMAASDCDFVKKWVVDMAHSYKMNMLNVSPKKPKKQPRPTRATLC